MTTLIQVSNSDGVVGRCDEKCYSATQPHCDCICGGRNHGRGEKIATENTRKIMTAEKVSKLKSDYERAHGIEAANIDFGKTLQTLPLFPL